MKFVSGSDREVDAVHQSLMYKTYDKQRTKLPPVQSKWGFKRRGAGTTES